MIHNTYPLKNVHIRRLAEIAPVEEPVYATESLQVNARECRLVIAGAGVYYALEGSQLRYAPEPGVDMQWATQQLEGLPLAALLHQRGVLHFHAASFVFEGEGVLLLGQSGEGKSSLTAAFALAGATALSDDLSAIVFEGSQPFIWPVDRQIRLRQNTIDQLQLRPSQLEAQEPFTGKYTLKTRPHQIDRFELNHLIHLETYPGTNTWLEYPPALEQFRLLRSEVCHWEILRGMPQTEKQYLAQILQMLNQTPLIRVQRPQNCYIKSLQNSIANFLRKKKQKAY